MTSWVPSHVELTIHQARDLLLKSKNSSSVVYVSVVAEREKSQSPFLPPSTAPLWQFTARIPLMSLDTTLLCTVRQKTSLKDKFLGLVSIPLSTFTISSKPVTHWYKLGAKAGKTSSKLRGELLLSIKFLSNWVAEEPDIIDFSFGSEKDQEIKKQKKLRTKSVKFSSSSSPLGFRRRGMLKRTKSEMRQRGGSDASADSTNSSGSSGAVGETDGKKKEKSKFRLSIKKKARSPVLEECSDEFMSLSLPLRTESSTSSVSSPSQTLSPLQGEGERDMFDGTGPPSEPLSRSLDSKSVPNGHSTTDVGEGGGGEGREMGGKDGEKQTPKTERMSPALRQHNFRKKRPWSMHTLPASLQAEREHQSPSTPHSRPIPETESEEKEKERGDKEVIFRATSSMARGVANGGRRVGRSNSTITDSSNLATPTRSPRALRSSERLSHQSRSSGMGNIALSSTLPTSVRQRSQSVGGATVTPPLRKTGSSTDRVSVAKMKAMGQGPRVPLATSLGDSPHQGSRGQSSPVHLVSEDHSPRSSPLAPRTAGYSATSTPLRNPSPINLHSTLVEEEEEDEVRSPTARDQGEREKSAVVVEQMVKSRVPIETESAAFQVDASELEVVLEATPKRHSIVALPSQRKNSSGSSSSQPASPLGSPARQRKLPITPGSTPEGGADMKTLPSSSASSSRKLPQLPTGLAPANSSRAHSTSPIVAKGESGRLESDGGAPSQIGRSASALGLTEVVEKEGETQPDGSDAGGCSGASGRIRHTVRVKEKSTPQADYEPLPALPPCLMQSHTLPRHTQLSRRRSELDRPLSGTPLSTLPGSVSSNFGPRHVQGVHNIRTFDPRLFGLPHQPPQRPTQQPKVSITNASFDETDSATSSSVSHQSPPTTTTTTMTMTASVSTQTRSVTPDAPHSPTKSLSSQQHQKLSQTYPGSPPSSSSTAEIGVLVGGGRKGGGLQAAISRYQENRRRSSKGSPSRKSSGGDLGNSKFTSAELEELKSASAGSTPVLQSRRASTHLGHDPRPLDKSWKNPFINLRRTQSHKAPPTGWSQQPADTADASRLQGPTPGSAESLGVSSNRGPGKGASSSSPSEHLTQQHLGLEPAAAAVRNTNSNNEQRGSQSVATPTTSDTDSLRTFGSERTLVEGGGGGDSVSGVGGTSLFLNLPPSSRHKQTCSSVDSEGLGSLASEEIEETSHVDWSQLTTEDLVKELVQTKSKLHSTEEELKAVRGYLDNLLLRIMETSPGILSVGHP